MMLELEKKVYIYSVESIGYARSLEKLAEQSELAVQFREAAGRIYTLLTDALEAEENQELANLFRESHSRASESRKYLEQTRSEDAGLQEKKKELATLIDDILARMDEVEQRLIY